MVAIVYMAAGTSSRFGGEIKGLAQITPTQKLIDISLAQALPAGFTEIVMIVSPQTKIPFEEHLSNEYKNLPVSYVLQNTEEDRDKPWGTTHAVSQLVGVINKPSVILNSDDLYGSHPIEVLHDAAKKQICAAVGYKLSNVMPEVGTVNRGIFHAKEGRVTNIHEHLNISRGTLEENNLTPNDLASMNMFALTPDTLLFLKNKCNEFQNIHKGHPTKECLLPIELCTLIEEGKIDLHLFETHESCTGVTRKEDVSEVQKYILSN
jgi:choline kinase